VLGPDGVCGVQRLPLAVVLPSYCGMVLWRLRSSRQPKYFAAGDTNLNTGPPWHGCWDWAQMVWAPKGGTLQGAALGEVASNAWGNTVPAKPGGTVRAHGGAAKAPAHARTSPDDRHVR
jgi:hypothetical protein